MKKIKRKLNNRCYLNGYMTIEASLIIPFVVAIYFFLIFTSFYLYNKCVLVQDTYIKCYRASVFTYWEDGYGEVSYRDLTKRNADKAREYLISRSDFSRYPFFRLKDEQINTYQILSDGYVGLSLSGTSRSFLVNDYELKISTVSWITNPVSNIRTARRNEKNDGD
ncbi:MAG: hypothetical protein FWG91_02375 [Lachnospiraceae bacterium]|nr:hypothetical protein [Lachnospiraceae bacterium]